MAEFGVEGPVYADRVGGKLTFRDWDKWESSDQLEWSQAFMLRAPKPVILKFMQKLGFIDERFS